MSQNDKPKPSRYKGPLKEKIHTVYGEKMHDQLLEYILSGNADVVGHLSPSERRMVTQWMDDYILEGNADNPVYQKLWDADYLRKPVSIEQFIDDDYYLGGKGNIGEQLYPAWRNDLSVIFAPESTISEVINTGSIGSGKTSESALAMCYSIYRQTCMRNPAQYYSLMTGSRIVFGVYSITLAQSSDTIYFKLKTLIDACRYFRDEFPRDTKLESAIRFKSKTHAIEVLHGSRGLHAIGRDLFSCAIDEANFMQVKEDKDRNQQVGQAYDLYSAVQSRIQSRFMRDGIIPGLLLLNSSRRAQTDFLEEHLAKVDGYKPGMSGAIQPLDPTQRPTVFVSDYSRWSVQPGRYKKLPFRVQVGDRVSRSRILKDGEEPRPEARVISVPGDFLKAFRQDVDLALRDVAGVATLAISPLISDPSTITDAIRKDLVHPFTSESLTIGTEDDYLLEHFWKRSVACKIVNSNYVPRLNPGLPRYIHVDLSLNNDCAGIGMCHLSGVVRTRDMRPDGTLFVTHKPFVLVDFVLRIIPPQGGENALFKFRSFILFLKQFYNVKLVTFDGFNSADCVQLLNRAGVKSELYSVDRTDDAYLGLRNAMTERRIGMYDYEPLKKELLFLERDIRKGKVDHPHKFPDGTPGSKDVSDGLAGCVHAAIADEESVIGDLPMIGGWNDPMLAEKRKQSRVIEPPKAEARRPAEVPAEAQAAGPAPGVSAPHSPDRPQESPVFTPGGKKFDWGKLRDNMKRQ